MGFHFILQLFFDTIDSVLSFQNNACIGLEVITDQILGVTDTTLRWRVALVEYLPCWGKKTNKQSNMGRRDPNKPGAKASLHEFFVQTCWAERTCPNASANFLERSKKGLRLAEEGKNLKTLQREAWLAMKEK